MLDLAALRAKREKQACLRQAETPDGTREKR
jgi:hypothetical protein